jgi:hypothetical protein
VNDDASYLWLGILLIGGGSSAQGLKVCELNGDICESQCPTAGVEVAPEQQTTVVPQMGVRFQSVRGAGANDGGMSGKD